MLGPLGVRQGYEPIADYAIIGDCHSAALISKGGSVDWYCPGQFDAPAVFCRLLDARRGGYFSIAPATGFRPSRHYQEGTNILETTFHCHDGAQARLTDFMPIHRRASSRLGHDVGTSRQILRLVEGMGATCRLEVRFKPTFDFARARTELMVVPGKGVVAAAEDRRLVLYCPKVENTRLEAGEFRGSLELRPGERAWLALTHTSDQAEIARALDPDVSVRDLARTADYWTSWCSVNRYHGRYGRAVRRSALVLKLLTYEPTGAVVAAPTTSLPELIGGQRNWDYRYTWLRDASLMLYALSTLGYHEEATDFVGWLARVVGSDPAATPQIMYTIDGSRELTERELPHLEGYKGSSPVRVGNGASTQQQLDIFGDILGALYHFRHTVEDAPITPIPEPHERLSRRIWQLLSNLVEQAASRWQEPDSGIWEVRGGARHYVYSKLMCWTALDRGIKLAEEQRLPAPLARWRQVREEIRAAILERGYNRSLGAFTQALDGADLDSSVLAIPRFGLLPATDERVKSTASRILERLTTCGLVERYRSNDGLPGAEGTFALCSFWLVDALALGDRLEEAHELFDQLLTYRNDVGLMSEEIDPLAATDKLLGNFPQGFSHMALIGSAINLSHAAAHGAERHPQTDADRAIKAVNAVGPG